MFTKTNSETRRRHERLFEHPILKKLIQVPWPGIHRHPFRITAETIILRYAIKIRSVEIKILASNVST